LRSLEFVGGGVWKFRYGVLGKRLGTGFGICGFGFWVYSFGFITDGLWFGACDFEVGIWEFQGNGLWVLGRLGLADWVLDLELMV